MCARDPRRTSGWSFAVRRDQTLTRRLGCRAGSADPGFVLRRYLLLAFGRPDADLCQGISGWVCGRVKSLRTGRSGAGTRPDQVRSRCISGEDPRRQRQRVYEQVARSVGLSQRRPLGLQSTWKAHVWRADRGLQRQAARRVPQRELIPLARRRQAKSRSLAHALQSRETTQRLGKPAPQELAASSG